MKTLNKIKIMKITALLLFAIVLCSNSCNPPLVDIVYTIIVTNNSSEDIYVHIADLDSETQYPDTLLRTSIAALSKIKPNKLGYFDSRTPWDELFKNLPSDTLSVFFIDGSTFENEDCDIVRDKFDVLERHDLSFEDLKKIRFQITYP